MFIKKVQMAGLSGRFPLIQTVLTQSQPICDSACGRGPPDGRDHNYVGRAQGLWFIF